MDDHNDIIDLLRRFSTRHDPDRLDDAVASLAPHDETIVAALAEALTDDDAEVRLLAVEVLRELGPKAEAVLPAVIRALEDSDRIVRIASLEPVAAFGEKAMDAVPILEKWLSNSPEFDKVSAAGHILMIDPSKSDEMMPFIDEALASDNTMIQRQAEWLLDQLGTPPT
jgi:HEAT repeat protein